MPIEIAQEDFQKQEVGLLATVMEKIDAKVQEWVDSIESPSTCERNDRHNSIGQALTPNTKNLFTSLTPQRKELFVKGYEAGCSSSIITTESDTNQSITPASVITCNAPIPLSSRGTKGNGGDSLNTMQHEAHGNPAKKRLFPNETIGAMARSTYQYSVQAKKQTCKRKGKEPKAREGKETKKTKGKNVGVQLCDLCRICRKEHSQSGLWVQCDRCDLWYHM
ncbi:Hypothetical predicted protein [Paramuricea clavata]|uniref:Uncharacterized protein n=1 Tax=Paramuricea clavata TaxID=317549 RepID=A0A7D9IFN2_PARCT|nr:Hypothetical predicted protein [Paramuricea clavata]